jgi:hypothetical protein
VADYCNSPDTLTLTVGSTTIDLMSDQQGFRVSALDLGYPAVREVVIDNSDRSGATDLTKLLGPRPVTITGALVPSPVGSRQQAWHKLAPFLDPSARVTMTYRVDGDTVVKTMTLRVAQATALFDNPTTSPAQLGFKAADPLAYDARVQTAVAFGGASNVGGRAYNLVYNRVYPAGGGATSVFTYNNGDFPVYPLLRLYGPATNIVVNWGPASATGGPITFVPSYSVAAGHYLAIDCKARTIQVDGDPSQNAYGQVQSMLTWPYIPAGAPNNTAVWSFTATGTSNQSQLVIQWQDGYLL